MVHTRQLAFTVYFVVYIRPFSRDMDTECEIKVGEDFVINPQIKSALKSLGGVLTVEDI